MGMDVYGKEPRSEEGKYLSGTWIVMPTSVGTYFYEPTVDEVTRNRLHVEYLMIHDLNTRIMPCDTFLDLAVPVAQWLRVLQSIN